ncbi:hypothetical protein RMSM_05686 [Rhodopirellula maiorica SM1]|uniref:Uncharacterized protein n=1 Tax=Rhodopirellula maiorica SM1 TaxID=1265738 RepID=M5RPU1_9BACT|nr:hypothetical protein RMSM_05686 [Rhodopirellula maiorica SM1]
MKSSPQSFISPRGLFSIEFINLSIHVKAGFAATRITTNRID